MRGSMAAKQEHQIEVISRALNTLHNASLEQIEAIVGPSIPHRTLIRRLASMVEKGLIEKTGTSRAAKYRLTEKTSTDHTTPDRKPSQADMFVPLSKTGSDLLRKISRP